MCNYNEYLLDQSNRNELGISIDIKQFNSIVADSVLVI
jgi:hypothetical protein